MSFFGNKSGKLEKKITGEKKLSDKKTGKEAMDDKSIIPQLYYITNDYKTSYLGIEKVNDESAYKIKVTKPSGKVSSEYYSTKTGLLLREESTETEGGQEVSITLDYTDYRKVGTLMFPFGFTQSVSGQDLVFKVTDMKINEGVTDADFK